MSSEVMKQEGAVVAVQSQNPIMQIPQAAQNAIAKASAGAILLHPEMIEKIERMAVIMASSKFTVPKHLAGNDADCFAVCLQALQWGMNPFAVAQKTHQVNGTLGYEAQLVAAVIVNSGAIESDVDYKWDGPWEKIGPKNAIDLEKSVSVTFSATLKPSGSRKSLTLALSQASVRNSPLWSSDPKQQLAYLAIKRFARLYCPGAILGVYTPDEAEEFGQPVQQQATVKPASYFGDIKPKAQVPVASEPAKQEPTTQTEATTAQEPAAKPQEEGRPGCITAEQFKLIDEARRKGKASGEKFLSGLRLFYDIDDPRNIKIEQLPDLITWALNGCNEPSSEPFEFNEAEKEG